MADQKALKKRLKLVMQRPENQVCSDCPEKKPTWASLIVAPPGAPPGARTIGAFCCLECSGSHRRLGVHISFVRSVNLDSWKEKEVQAMENGGNGKVNAIFEANLARMGVNKPSNLASGPQRERFIRDKYERRKFYDPAFYSLEGGGPGPGGNVAAPPSTSPSHAPRPGAPSEAARQRVLSRQRQAGMKPVHSFNMDSQPPAAKPKQTRPKVAAAPVSAPVTVDLLDFSSSQQASPPASAAADPFAAPPPAQPAPAASPHDAFAQPSPQTRQPSSQVQKPVPQVQQSQPNMQQQSANQGSVASDFASFANPAPANVPQQKSNSDIMALFNTPQPTAFGMPGMGGTMANNPALMGMMGAQQRSNNNMGSGYAKPMVQGGMSGGAVNPMQMQQMMMMGGNPQMMLNSQMMMNPQMMAMMRNGMPQQQQAAQMMMMQQGSQQKMMMGNPQMMMGGPQMMGSSNGTGGANMNAMMKGMQQMSMGQQSQQQQTNADADGFGSGAMGGGGAGSQDPFSSLGGMNAFR